MNDSQLITEILKKHEMVINFGRKQDISNLNELLDYAKERGMEVKP